jgi:acylphosphatase
MQPGSYATDVEGGAPVRVRYRIAGRMRVADYVRFVAERARWFGIDGWVSGDADAVTLVAAGPEAMVGALEMACTLGPLTAVIDDVAVEDEQSQVRAGFEIRGQK